MSNHEGHDIAYEYAVRFYPRYFTWVQFNINSDNSQRQGSGANYENRLTGPLGMGPEYKVVVAIRSTMTRSTPRRSSTCSRSG